MGLLILCLSILLEDGKQHCFHKPKGDPVPKPWAKFTLSIKKELDEV